MSSFWSVLSRVANSRTVFPDPILTSDTSLRDQSASSSVRRGYFFRSFRYSQLHSSSPRYSTVE